MSKMDNDGIYAVVKRYEKEEDGVVIVEFDDWYYKPDHYDKIYNKIMELSDNDHELAEDAASWCLTAPVEAIYETDNWEIEIQEIP